MIKNNYLNYNKHHIMISLKEFSLELSIINKFTIDVYNLNFLPNPLSTVTFAFR